MLVCISPQTTSLYVFVVCVFVALYDSMAPFLSDTDSDLSPNSPTRVPQMEKYIYVFFFNKVVTQAPSPTPLPYKICQAIAIFRIIMKCLGCTEK